MTASLRIYVKNSFARFAQIQAHRLSYHRQIREGIIKLPFQIRAELPEALDPDNDREE